LKNEKKMWCNDLKLATTKMKITKVRDEQKTVGIPDLRHSRYATRMMQIERQTNCFMRAVICQWIWF